MRVEFEELLNSGIQAFQAGNYQMALALFDLSLAINPNSDWAWNIRGIVLCDRLQQYEEAVASFDRALELKPYNPTVWYNRGVALQNLSRNQEAIASCTQALYYAPDHADAWYLRGKCYYALGCSEEPLTNHGDASHILNYLPTDRTGNFEEALASYNRALAITPDLRNALIRKAEVLMALCRYEEALISYNYVIDLNPNDCVVWHNRGFVLEKLRRSEEALASYDYALHVNPDFVYAWYHRANLLLNQFRRYEEALISYAQVGLDQQQVQYKVVGKRLTTSVLNVENSQENLPYAAVESTAIAQLYPNTQYIRNSAVTQVAVTQALQSGAGIFHFSGHAEHDLNLPSESSLHLTNDERLTLRDIFELDMSSYNLVCL